MWVLESMSDYAEQNPLVHTHAQFNVHKQHTQSHTHIFTFDVSNCLSTLMKILYTKLGRLGAIKGQSIDCFIFLMTNPVMYRTL